MRKRKKMDGANFLVLALLTRKLHSFVFFFNWLLIVYCEFVATNFIISDLNK